MASTLTFTNIKDVAVDVIGPGSPDVFPQADKRHGGTFRGKRATCTFGGTYVTTGEVLTAAQLQSLGLTFVQAILVATDQPVAATVGMVQYVPATGKLKLFVLTTGVEVANAAALSGSLDLIFLGKG